MRGQQADNLAFLSICILNLCAKLFSAREFLRLFLTLLLLSRILAQGPIPAPLSILPHTFIITPIRVKEKFSLTFSERGTFGLSLLFPGRFFHPVFISLARLVRRNSAFEPSFELHNAPKNAAKRIGTTRSTYPNGQLAQFGILSGNTYPAPRCRSSEARCVAIARFVVF
jgi:hypothetical protein